MRFYIPVMLFFLSMGWAVYSGIVKKNWEQAQEITGITVFFGLVWGLIYYLILS